MAEVITQQRLKELVYYDPDTGDFTWLVDRSEKVKAGDLAGGRNKSRGYRRIGIDYRNYPQHRLAFLYMTGEFPKFFVDHINGDRGDNRWCNLRAADYSQNASNKCMQSNNTSGHIGIWKPKSRNKWVVQVCGQHVAYCDTLKEAKAAYRKAAKNKFGEFYREQEAA